MNCTDIDITDIVMPEWITCWRNEGYGFKHTDPLRRTNMNSGRVLTRQMYDFVPSHVDVKMRIASNHAAAFEAWYRDTLDNGQQWFRARLMSPLGDDKEFTVRFASMYSGPVKNNALFSKWDYSAELEVIDRPLWPDGWGKVPELIAGAKCLDRMMTQALQIV